MGKGTMRAVAAAWMLALACWSGTAAAQEKVDLEPHLRDNDFEQLRISPDGRHYAASVRLEDRMHLVVMDRESGKVIQTAAGQARSAIADFWWVNDQRIVLSIAETFGSRDPVYPTGELHAFSIGEKRPKVVFGDSAAGGQSRRLGDDGNRQMATVVDTLPDDPDHVLIGTWSLEATPRTRVLRMNVNTGGLTTLAVAPLRRSGFTIDQAGAVRFAYGVDDANVSRLYYRASDADGWTLINDQATSGRSMDAVGFSADGTVAYLQVMQPDGPDTIETWNVETRARAVLLRDPVVDPDSIIFDADGRTPIGARYVHDGVRLRFFDEGGPMAKVYRALEKAVPGSGVSITSFTRDRGMALLRTWSDRSADAFHLVDFAKPGISPVFARRAWRDASSVPPTRSISLTARDGTPLHGYLTTPVGPGRGLPMVVLPHGGPFGIHDSWHYDDETQLLADAGYAVLRINYRGSGNYGLRFVRLGAREWGGTMQDDLTDATRWAIKEGVADPARICIYGASYGGYAALMGVAREPELYKCAAGYVGVYDLVEMQREDSRYAAWMKSWSQDWVGPRASLAGRSPVNLAERVKVPVFLAAGGADLRAPIVHSRRMEKALRANGVEVETLYYPSEGHGFTQRAHRKAFYTQLLAFLSKHIGGRAAE